jgi:hypothetical protein
MPTTDINLAARTTLFNKCYGLCRTLREIIAYTDGEITELKWHNNRQVSPEFYRAVSLDEHRTEVVRWRELFASTWEQLQADNLVVHATENEDDRPIDELAYIYETTATMIGALERRLLHLLLQGR